MVEEPGTQLQSSEALLLSPEIDRPQEHCAVVGVWVDQEHVKSTDNPGGLDVRTVIYNMLQSLQNRGEEGSGIAASDGMQSFVIRGLGRVVNAFRSRNIEANKIHDTLPENVFVGIGHNLYGTSGQKTSNEKMNKKRLHPFSRKIDDNDQLLVAHNGNNNNSVELCEEYGLNPEKFVSDTDVMTKVIQIELKRTGSLEQAVAVACRKFNGAYALTIMTKDTLIGVCDPFGFRPLELGRIPGKGWVMASETTAFNMAGAHHVRSVEPGEMVIVDKHGQRSKTVHRPEETQRRRCIIEPVYFANPDSTEDYFPEGIDGVRVRRSVADSRNEMGVLLAQQLVTDADKVVCVPESARYAAEGYAQASGIPIDSAITKNHFVGRTFQRPSQDLREVAVNIKLKPLRDRVYNQRLVVVEDSVVRGTTLKRMVLQLREAGAREVHIRVSSPPFKWPCFHGIDFPTQGELLAPDMSIEEMCLALGADSLDFLTLDNLHTATTGKAAVKAYCDACLTGDYPAPVPNVGAQPVAMTHKLTALKP